jgi:hypothetical protein
MSAPMPARRQVSHAADKLILNKGILGAPPSAQKIVYLRD